MLRFAAVLVALGSFTGSARAGSCGRIPEDADWFFLAEAPPAYATAASHVLKAIHEGLDPAVLPRDPSCLHVSVLGDLRKRSASLSTRRHDELPSGTVGFHLAKLGSDNTVYVAPTSSVPLEIVMLHETLHALSHRFSKEAQQRRFAHIVEGTTDYITRELAVLSLGYRRENMHSGYDEYVRFMTALVRRLGDDGALLVGDSYFRDGYTVFEKQVDTRLHVSLGTAARELEKDHASAAVRLLYP